MARADRVRCCSMSSKTGGARILFTHARTVCESYTIRPFEPDGCKKTTCARQCE